MTSTATPAPTLAGTFTVDAATSAVRFSVAHFRIQRVRGTLTGLTGSVEVKDGHLKAEGQVDATSIRTGTGSRDAHLRSYLLDADAYPVLALRVDAPLARQVPATITIRGRETPVVVNLEHRGPERLNAAFTLDRREARLTWPAPVEAGGVAVGREIRVVLDLALRSRP